MLKRFKLASREFQPDRTVVKVDDLRIGGGSMIVMAGPCSVESDQQLMSTALAVKAAPTRLTARKAQAAVIELSYLTAVGCGEGRFVPLPGTYSSQYSCSRM